MILTKEHIAGICFHDLAPLWAGLSTDFPKTMDTVPQKVRIRNTEFMEKTDALLDDVKAPRRLSEIGVVWEDIEGIAGRAMGEKVIALSPKTVAKGDIIRVMEEIF